MTGSFILWLYRVRSQSLTGVLSGGSSFICLSPPTIKFAVNTTWLPALRQPRVGNGSKYVYFPFASLQCNAMWQRCVCGVIFLNLMLHFQVLFYLKARNKKNDWKRYLIKPSFFKSLIKELRHFRRQGSTVRSGSSGWYFWSINHCFVCCHDQSQA